MGLGCGATCMKYILFVFNFIFFLCGAIILGVAIWIQVDDTANSYIKIVNYDNNSDLYRGALIILCVVGAIIFLVGFLGCCGACKESSCMLATYAALLILILILQFVGAILAVIFRNKLDDKLEESMMKIVMKEVKADPKDTWTLAYGGLQYELKCCGALNFTDYRDNPDYGTAYQDTRPVPPTCCKMSEYEKDNPKPDDQAACYAAAQGWSMDPASEQLYKDGCYDKMKAWLKDRLTIVVAVGFGLIAFEILCIIFACCVRSAIKEKV